MCVSAMKCKLGLKCGGLSLPVTGKSLKFVDFQIVFADFGPRLPVNQLNDNQKINELETCASDWSLPV